MQNDPRKISIADFTYELPHERIAKYPLPDRDASKLLVYRDGKIFSKIFRDLPGEISPGSMLVFNISRVVRARLLLQRTSGTVIEIFCTDAAEASIDFVQLLQQQNEVQLRAFVGNAKRWKENETLTLELKFGDEKILLHANRIAQAEEQSVIHLSWTPGNFSFGEILEAAGRIPLPPYLNREDESLDAVRYQTVYAKEKGSVAAPTSGLHFTENILQQLLEKKIHFENVTLHVGAGTFLPVKSETMLDHAMHREQIFIPRSLVENLAEGKNKPVVAVGTTSLRTLESLYWFGKQLITNPGKFYDSIFVSQWEPYENSIDVPAPVALRAVRDWMREYGKENVSGYTQLLIAPGYQFKIADALITNFHQPQSTLLLLVAAFIGENYERVYDFALKNDFRFLSYGDASLLWGKKYL